MVKKKSVTTAASSTSGGAAAKPPSIPPKGGAPSAPPPAPAPPAPSSSVAKPGDWTASTVTKRDEKRSRSLGLISSDEGNVILPAVEEAKASPAKRSIGGFADEDDLLDCFRSFSSSSSSRGSGLDCFFPLQGKGCSCHHHDSSFCVISSLEAFASQFTSLEADNVRLQEEVKSSSSKLDGAIKKAAMARQEVDSLKEELGKLKEKLKEEETRAAEKDELLRQSSLALLEAANIPAAALDTVPNNSPANGVSMALASHQLTRELLERGKGALARMHLMIFPKLKQDKTLGQLVEAFAVDTKEVIEVFKRTSRTYGALLAFQLMMGHGFKANIEEMTKELPKGQDGQFVFPVPSFVDDSSGALPEVDRIQPAGGTFMSITLGAATKLLDDMMINYSEWHTERAPQGKKVNSVEETSSLSDKIDVIMSMLVNGRSNVDPNNVPLASLVAQEENVDVNFIKNNNFNNNAYRNNSGNNYRPYPSANGNGYGNSYGNSYNNNRNVPSGLEAMLKEFISTQTAFNKSVEEKLDKIDIIASRVDRLASDVNLLKLKVMPNNDIDNKITTTANAIQVRINENIRLMAELRARWDREENEKLAKENNVAKVWTITTTSNANSSHVAAPPTINGKIIGVGNVSTPSAKRTKLPEIAKTAETACDKTAEIFSNLGNNDPIAVAHNDLDFDDCHISEVIKFLQKLAKSPNASAINLAFTKHITNALIKAREEKLKLETSIPRKLEDGWEPIIKMKFNDFECNALCDLGASISVMPKKIYDMLDLPPLKNCYLDVNLADNVKKKPLGRIDNVHITVNNNLVPVDFVVLDIECNASCPIVLGRPFLRTVGAVIDMREGNIKYQFPLKKGMEHFPRKRMKLPFDSIIRTSYDVDASTLDNT
ncbi:hypothetical protein QYE76_023946 [Lolium multiflorum]|uniref:Uncharacterized protein n=1 Tax=Lolium multiflorum TaxID=4521 RepID=A0AAD8RE70_LOLMU|nr:hypothetical protein QYE76_023946 [Lolium multiflorum]